MYPNERITIRFFWNMWWFTCTWKGKSNLWRNHHSLQMTYPLWHIKMQTNSTIECIFGNAWHISVLNICFKHFLIVSAKQNPYIIDKALAFNVANVLIYFTSMLLCILSPTFPTPPWHSQLYMEYLKKKLKWMNLKSTSLLSCTWRNEESWINL